MAWMSEEESAEIWKLLSAWCEGGFSYCNLVGSEHVILHPELIINL